MTTTTHRETAKIYQFPAGGRAGLRNTRPVAKPAENVAGARVPDTVFGSSWYHEEAVRDGEQAGKR